MKASRDESGNLIVTNVEMFVRGLLVVFGVGVVAAWLAPIPTRQSLGWSVVCAVFGLALLAANERSTFVFDRRSALLRWRKDTPFRHLAGEMPFAAITALSIERDFKSAAPSPGRGGARRLVLLTTSGPIPIEHFRDFERVQHCPAIRHGELDFAGGNGQSRQVELPLRQTNAYRRCALAPSSRHTCQRVRVCA
jgi:hypothetical protein